MKKHYHGSRTQDGAVIVTVVGADGAAQPLAMRQDLKSYARASAFAWGDASHGAKALALALCVDALGDTGAGLRVHAEFAAVALLDIDADEWAMDADAVRELCADLGVEGPLPEERAEAQPQPAPMKGGDPPRAAAVNVSAAVKAQGFTDDEQIIGGLCAHWRAASAMLKRGIMTGDPLAMVMGAEEAQSVFARLVAVATEDGGRFAMSSARIVAVAEAVEKATMAESRKIMAGMKAPADDKRADGDDLPGRIVH